MLTPFKSPLIADVGISMGDEGKGRLVYEVADELEAAGREVAMVMKVNGGANSGHTAGGLKLNLLPAGVILPRVRHLAIGCGVVADPRKFLWEARPLEVRGYDILGRLAIDERTLVSDLSHRLLDLAWEDYRTYVLGEEPRGSTGRGITPAYADEVGQFQIFYGDFLGPREVFKRKLVHRLNRAARIIEHVCLLDPEKWTGLFEKLTLAETRANQPAIEEGIFPAEAFDFTRFCAGQPFRVDHESVVEDYWEAGQALVACVKDVRELTLGSLARGACVIGEFGQSYWLDKRHGFPPNVTASHTYTPELFQSAGIPAQPVHTMGCCKAYDTKVGTHLFLTQMEEDHPLTARLKKLEFGTSTGRQRMVGWFDAVEKADALRYGGCDDLVLNKLDALGLGEDWPEGTLRVCTHYVDTQGREYRRVPRNDTVRADLRPVYTELPAWRADISGVRRFADLPEEARGYVRCCLRTIWELARGRGEGPAAPPNLRYIGVGPGPAQIIKDVPPAEELVREA